MYKLRIVGAALFGAAMMTQTADAQVVRCRPVVGTGGGSVRSPETVLTGTFGQPVAGVAGDLLRRVAHGFWIPSHSDISISASDVAAVTGGASSTLLQASPNPLRRGTDLAVRVPSGIVMSLRLADAAGNRVRTLLAGERADGELRHIWIDADGLPSGAYSVVLDAGVERRSIQIVLVR